MAPGVGLGLALTRRRGKQDMWRSRRSARRLIHLIFAGRNRMLISRRELPPAIGLHSISGLNRNQSGGNNVATPTERSQQPIDDLSSGTGLVAGVQLLDGTELAYQSSDRFLAVGNRAQGSDFSVGFSNGNSNGFSVDIKTDKSYVYHGPAPFACGSAPSVTSTYSVTRDIAKQESVFFFYGKLPTAVSVSDND